MDEKEIKIKNLMKENGLEALLLGTRANFLWATGGKRNDVIKNEDTCLAYLFFTENSKYLIASSSDMDRIKEEELFGLGFETVTYNWYDQSFADAIKKIGNYTKIGNDFYHQGFLNIEGKLAKERINLSSTEIEKISRLCREYTRIFTDFCQGLKKGEKENEIAAELNYICSKAKINLPVLMVGSDNRIYKYKHPVPTDKKIDKYVLIATVAERDGLNASISRSIYFGDPPKGLIERIKAVNYIESFYYSCSNPGQALGNIINKGKEIYSKLGYSGQWEKHTQGGLIGYKPREFLATQGSNIKISPGNALSWNPTLEGAKAEDMILVKDEGINQLSIDKRWPYEEIKIEGINYLKPELLLI